MVLNSIVSSFSSWLTQQAAQYATAQASSMLLHLSPLALIVLGIIVLFAGKAIVKLIAIILIIMGVIALFGMNLWQII